MNIKYFLIIFSLFSSIVSIQDNQKYELEMDTSKKFFLNNMTSDKTLYIYIQKIEFLEFMYMI